MYARAWGPIEHPDRARLPRHRGARHAACVCARHRRRRRADRQRRRLQPAADAHDERDQRVPADVDPLLHPGGRADDEGGHHGAADRPRQCGRRTSARRPRARDDARRPRTVDRVRRGGGRRERARQHAHSIAAQVVRAWLLDGGGRGGCEPRPDHPAIGRDDRLCVHGGADRLRGRHVHGRRDARPHPGDDDDGACARSSPSAATIRSPDRRVLVGAHRPRAQALARHLPACRWW